MKSLRKLLILLLLAPVFAMAGVNLKNGNFFINYTDVILTQSPEALEITRTYNSKATEIGWFGFGWGSDYETRLVVAPEGAVVIHENGTGYTVWFNPDAPVDIEAAAQRVLDAMVRDGDLEAGQRPDEIKQQLVSNADLRLKKSAKHRVWPDLPVGARFLSLQSGEQHVERTATGFVRTQKADGRVQYFDQEGRLVRVVNRDGKATKIRYRNGNVRSIQDGFGQKIELRTNADGRIVRLWRNKKQVATYRYQDKDLIESHDTDGNRFTYTYDARHNLTSVRYTDGREMHIDYDEKTSMVTRVAERDGTERRYQYGANPKTPDLYYWTEVTTQSPGKDATRSRYEYEIRTRANGTNYLYRALTETDGMRDERTYSECCEKPLLIDRGGKITRFEYDDKGRLTYRKSHEEETRLAYDAATGKIARIDTGSNWMTYAYDARGNLLIAESSEGEKMQMTRDQENRIVELIDRPQPEAAGTTLRFKYNKHNKPVEIRVLDVGVLTVQYDSRGEVKKVDASDKTAVPEKINESLLRFKTLANPAGVSLGF